MFLSELSIKRPVLAIVMSLVLVLFGLVSVFLLSVREYPDIDPPVISVSTVYPGASAEIIESTVTEALEDEVIGIDGIKSMFSTSREGISNIVIEFELNKPVDVAAQDVRDRVSRARGRLPDDIEEPVIAKQDTDASAIIWLGLSGENYSALQITDYADRHLVDALQTAPGVGQVIIGGAREYAMRVWLDPARMTSRGVTVLDVEKALRNENVEIPSGRLESVNREFTIRTRGELNTPEQFERLIIKRVGGQPVYLSDIGRAEVGAKNERSLVRMDGKPAVGLGIVKQSKANTLDVAREVKKKVAELEPTLPAGLTMKPAYDSSIFIQRSIDEVVESLLLAIFLVILVNFLFLRNLRATLIPSVAIPISMIGTFVLMWMLGYTINTITLLGMTIAIGLVVDDSIVVLENIYRRMELGESPMEAATKGIREIGFAVIATTAVLVAVFLPIVFLQGITGRMLKEFAVVVAGSVIISGFVSLTLTPMMCSRILKLETHGGAGRQSFLHRLLEGFHHWLENVADRYQRILVWLMRWKTPVFIATGVMVVLSGVFFFLLPKEFLPTDDRGTILTIISAPEGATMGYTDQAVRKAEAIYHEQSEVQRMFAVIALSAEGEGQVNNGLMFVNLKPMEERKRKQQQIVQAVMPQMMSIPEAFVFPINPPSGPVQGFSKAVEMAVQTTGDIQQLAEVADRISQRATREVFGLVNIDSDLKLNKPQLEVAINREKASLLGVSVRDIARTMQILLGGLDISTFQHEGKRYDVMVQALPKFRMTPDQLASIYVPGRDDMLVPLVNVVQTVESVTPKELNHYNRLRSATISGSLIPAPGVSLGSVLPKLESIAKEEMTSQMSIAWRGEAKEFFDASNAVYFSFLVALLVIYLVLSAQFESFKDPLIVILTVPLALFGALLTLFALSSGSMLLKMLPFMQDWMPVNYSLNIYSQIGLVLLIGLVTKNGILIVEFANQIREAHPEKRMAECVCEAARIRFRPILMTTFSTMLGALPIAIGLGAGIDGRKPLGAELVGGMFFATLLTLFVIPLAYDWMNRRRERGQSSPVPLNLPPSEAAECS